MQYKPEKCPFLSLNFAEYVGSKSTNIFSRGNRNGIWEQIRGIEGSYVFMELASIVMGGGFKSGLPQLIVKGLCNQS